MRKLSKNLLNYITITKALCRNDLSWDGESKRIIAVGAGKEQYVLPYRPLTARN